MAAARGRRRYEWLRADLAANPSQCTAAYWDTPRFSSGQKHGNDLNYVPFWQVLYEHGVEFVMGGNDHHYERFAPQTPYGDLDLTDGIRQFVVGTGGRFLRPVTRHAAAPTARPATTRTHGILRVGLLDDELRVGVRAGRGRHVHRLGQHRLSLRPAVRGLSRPRRPRSM